MDRNEAIDILRVIAPPRTNKKAFYDFMEARDMAIAALKGKDIDIPTKWIPVSERLPEEGQKCLVCDNGWISIDTFVGHGNPYNWKLYVRDYEAWMPLPEPYRKEP